MRSVARQRYNRRALILSVVYAALLFPAISLLSHHAVGGALAYAVGIAPALAVCGYFWAMGLYLVEETDEYLRMIQIRQLLAATAIALSAATIWGFLEGFGLVSHVPAFIWPVVWCVALALSGVVLFLVARRAA